METSESASAFGPCTEAEENDFDRSSQAGDSEGGRGPYRLDLRPCRAFAWVEGAGAEAVLLAAATIGGLRRTSLCGRDGGPRTRPACS